MQDDQPQVRRQRMKAHVLPQLVTRVEEGGYSLYTFDYEKDLPDGTNGRKAWTNVFRKAIPQFEKRCRLQLLEDASSDFDEACASDSASAFAKEYARILDKLEEDPDQVPDLKYEREHKRKRSKGLDCKVLCAIREKCMMDIGLRDAFRHVKTKENADSLKLLSTMLDELDAINSKVSRFELAIKNCFAGNLFDLGAHFSSEKYEKGFTSFQDVRGNLPQRPWLIDCLDSLLKYLVEECKKVVIFVDNSGSDVVLGILPLCRELLKNKVKVVLAANEKPSINDITCDELLAMFTRAKNRPRVEDHILRAAAEDGNLSIVSTGSDLPIIDLSELSSEVVDAAEDADLIVLQGMGRGIETNLNAKFYSSVLKMGVVKHPEVALCLNGQLGDCICKFEPKIK